MRKKIYYCTGNIGTNLVIRAEHKKTFTIVHVSNLSVTVLKLKVTGKTYKKQVFVSVPELRKNDTKCTRPDSFRDLFFILPGFIVLIRIYLVLLFTAHLPFTESV